MLAIKDVEPNITGTQDDMEICDKCGTTLSMTKNEDIFLELIQMVLCAPCHEEHKGIEKYWSSEALEEYKEQLCS